MLVRAALTSTAAAVASFALLVLSACAPAPGTSDPATANPGGSAADAHRLQIVAGLYPLAYAAEQVGGDLVDVTTLAAPGVEPHDLELSPTQVIEVADADLVLHITGLQPALDDAVALEAPDRALDLAAGDDPHVWLAPASMAELGRRVAERLSALDPASAAAFDAGAEALDQRMTALDAEFRAGLATCASRDVVVSHEAFGRLADAYDLTQVGLSGLDPEAEPSPARLREVVDQVRASAITTVFYEPLANADVAETIAAETGATSAVLDPIESATAGSDYETLMRANLAALHAGLGCS